MRVRFPSPARKIELEPRVLNEIPSRLRAVLVALILLFLGAGVVSAFVVDGDDRGQQGAAPSTSDGTGGTDGAEPDADADDAGGSAGTEDETTTTAIGGAPGGGTTGAGAGTATGAGSGGGGSAGGGTSGSGSTGSGTSGSGTGTGSGTSGTSDSDGSGSGSGLGGSGTGAVANGTSPVPETGGESLLLPGMGLLAAAGAARRLRRR